MSFWSFNVAAAVAGGGSVNSAAFESLAAQTLEGIQSAQFEAVWPRQEAPSIDGQGDAVAVERPRARLDLVWPFCSGENESAIGLVLAPSGAVSALSAINEERNYYLLVNQNGHDGMGPIDPGSRILALGNAVLTRYDFAAQVGQPTTVSVSLEGLNLLIQPSGTGQPLPSLNKETAVGNTGRYILPTPSQAISSYTEAAPGSLVLTFNTGSAFGALLSGQNSCPVDSFGFTVELPRADVQTLGWAYPSSRPVQWPATVNVRAEAYLNTFQLDALNRPNCPDSGYSVQVGFRNSCTTVDDLAFRFNGLKLDTASMGAAVGGGVAKVAFSWSAQIYDVNRIGPQNANWFILDTGQAYSSVVFPQVDYVSGSAPLTFDLSTGCFLFIVSGPGLLSGNSVFVTDETATIVVRCAATDGSDTQDLTVTVS